jgi:hypothetical protein
MQRITGVFLALLILVLIISCKREDPAPIDSLLIGKWNGYEAGNETGFAPVFYSLTLLYEHGITFLPDKTFNPRYRLDAMNVDGLWEERRAGGHYTVINNKRIALTFDLNDPGSTGYLEVEIIKLDDKYLWFKHSYFGYEKEYHLKRVE